MFNLFHMYVLIEHGPAQTQTLVLNFFYLDLQ